MQRFAPHLSMVLPVAFQAVWYFLKYHYRQKRPISSSTANNIRPWQGLLMPLYPLAHLAVTWKDNQKAAEPSPASKETLAIEPWKTSREIWLYTTLGCLVGCVNSCLTGCVYYHKQVNPSVQRCCQKDTVRARPPPPPPHKEVPSPQEDAKTKAKELEKLQPLTLTSRELQ